MKKVITREQIEKYNQMVEASRGTGAYRRLALRQEYREDDTKRWRYSSMYCLLQTITMYPFDGNEGDRFYLKTIKDSVYLYADLEGEPADRYCLDGNEIAKAFFGV